MKKNVLLGVVGVLLLVSLAGNFYFIFGQKSENSNTGKVCLDADIQKFNSLYKKDDTSSENWDKFKAEISSKMDYKKDINCATVLYYANYQQRNAAGVKENFQIISDLVSKGESPSLKIFPLNSMEYLEAGSKTVFSNEMKG